MPTEHSVIGTVEVSPGSSDGVLERQRPRDRYVGSGVA